MTGYSMSTITALSTSIFCRLCDARQAAPGDIVLPDNAEELADPYFEVLSIGEGVTLPIAVGDRIIFDIRAALPYKPSDRTFFIEQACVRGKHVTPSPSN